MIQRALFALLIVLAATSLFAAPEVSVGKSVYGPAPGFHWTPSVATDGTGYLAIWRDGRAEAAERLLATRIAGDGDVLDPFGLVIAEEIASEARVVWNGSRYVVVWGSGGRRVMAATVDRDGNVSAPKVIADQAILTGLMHTASDGNATLIAYTHGTEARAALLDRDANITADVRLAPEGIHRSSFAVATNGREFMVSWSEGIEGDAVAVRVSRTGSVIGTPRNLGPGATPLLASDGTDYVLVVRRHHGGELTWSSRRLAGDLSDVDPTLPVPEGNLMSEPTLLWNGSEYLFVAQLFTNIVSVPYRLAAVRIGSHGRPLTDPVEVEDVTSEQPGAPNPDASAATNGRTLLAAWIESSRHETGDRENRVVARLYDALSLSGMGNGVLLSISANRQMDPSMAFSASNSLVAWRETAGIWFTRVSTDGVSLDERVELSTARNVSAPEVTFDGLQYTVAWIEAGAIEIRFITPDGVVLDDELRIANAKSFAIANAGRTVVAWTDETNRLWAARIDRDSRKAEVPVAVTPANMNAYDPAISWNRREILIVFTEVLPGFWHFPILEPIAIRGARLTSTFNLIDTAPLRIGDVADVEDSHPSVATNGDEWLVTWTTGFDQLRANRVQRNGTLSGPVEGTLLGAAQSSEVAFDGARYAIAFKYNRAMRVGFVPANGPVAFNAMTVIGDTKSNQEEYSLIRGGESVALAYARVSDAPGHAGVERAFIRYVEPVRKTRSVRR